MNWLQSDVRSRGGSVGEYENTAAEVHLPPSRTPRTFVRSNAPRLEGGRRRGKAAISNKGIFYKKNGMAYGGGRSKRCDLPLAHSLPLSRPAKSMNLLHQFVQQQSSSRPSRPRLPALDAIARFYTPAIYIASAALSPPPLPWAIILSQPHCLLAPPVHVKETH